MATRLARSLHPVAWWGWAIGLAVAASMTTNPLLLGLIAAVVTIVVMSRRGDSPWSRAFRLYVILAVFIVVFRVVLHILVGMKYGDIQVLALPQVELPHWAAGISLLGNVQLEGLLGAALTGARLGTLIIAIGAANALANPKRLLRSLPNALHEIGTAVVVAVSVAPQLAESVGRVLRARLLRGETGRGIRLLPRVALPVLQDTLDRSLMLAAAMESRGYGRRTLSRNRTITAAATLTGLLAMAMGMYGVLDTAHVAAWLGLPLVLAGLALVAVGMTLGGRGIRVTAYRPDPWGLAETLTVLCGAAAPSALLLAHRYTPLLLDQPLQPLAAPGLPLVAAAGILVAMLPAVLAPPAPAGRGR